MSVQSLFACCLALTAAAADNSYPPHYDDAKEIVYKTANDADLNLYLFTSQDHAASDQRPAVLFFFGGGWQNGSTTQFVPHARYLATRGLVGVCVDYRVASRQGVSPFECTQDALDAMRYVREHAEELGIDPQRIAAAGGSAGGHLAACTAALQTVNGHEVPDLCRPNALILFNPAVQIAPLKGNAEDEQSAALFRKINDRFKGRAAELSPLHHVTQKMPPAIIFHGLADTTVPFSTVERFTDAMREKGNRCLLVGFAGQEHGFFNENRNESVYQTTLFLTDRFLSGLGWIEGDPTVPSPVPAGRYTLHGSRELVKSPDAQEQKPARSEKPSDEGERPQRNRKSPATSCIHLRSGLLQSLKRFETQPSARVVFLGGSITEGAGWRDRVCDFLERRYPQCEFDFVNAGIASTGSTTGAFRLERDVLTPGKPDLLFIDAAVNDDQDEKLPEADAIRSMEGIVRHMRRESPQTDCVLIHFVNPALLEQTAAGETPVSIAAHERVAEHYSVPSVNVACELSRRITAGEFSWETYGGTHPKPAGHELAADLVVRLLTEAARIPSSGSVADLPEPLDPHCYAYGRLITPFTAQGQVTPKGQGTAKGEVQAGSFRQGVPNWSEIGGQVRPRYETLPLWFASSPGAELTLDFEGTALGLFVLAGPDAGQLEITIDNQPPRTVELFHEYSPSLHYPRTFVPAGDLSPGTHHAVLKVADSHHPESTGHAARILGFAVNPQPDSQAK